MLIVTPDSHEFAMINLCDYARLNVEDLGDGWWSLIAYKVKGPYSPSTRIVKSMDYNVLISMRNALAFDGRYPNLCPTTATFH